MSIINSIKSTTLSVLSWLGYKKQDNEVSEFSSEFQKLITEHHEFHRVYRNLLKDQFKDKITKSEFERNRQKYLKVEHHNWQNRDDLKAKRKRSKNSKSKHLNF
jgi:hypothetical protein